MTNDTTIRDVDLSLMRPQVEAKAEEYADT